jgi:hypothetical protein
MHGQEHFNFGKQASIYRVVLHKAASARWLVILVELEIYCILYVDNRNQKIL